MNTLYYSEFESPFGTTLASSDGQALYNIWFPGQKHAPDSQHWQRNDQLPLFQNLQQQLTEYAAGQRHCFELPLRPQGTAFQQQVWQALQLIAFGEHASYGTLAKQLGRPKAARAVGAAVGRNPLSIIIPCHRVLGSNGQLTGFASGLTMKKRLLKIEGLYQD
ncbi:MAG: methylated-DNA--[protein]-cysteine S-methyltransferase [Marinobacterium sp.]|nr:methylated-DNA--[protein]-cysteine S-methyltransferase [Marinobacterium sp.]